MNSLLQSLYFTPYFRKVVFQISTENDNPTESLPLALQKVFYHLMVDEVATGMFFLYFSIFINLTLIIFCNYFIDPQELINFFDRSMDMFSQHDVQEFNRVLQSELESKMNVFFTCNNPLYL